MCCPARSTARCISANLATNTRKTWRLAAAPPCLGGVTSVFEMPNTAPPTTSREAIAGQAGPRQTACIAIMLFMPARRPPISRELADLERLPGVCGIKAFLGSSTGTLLLSKPDGYSGRAQIWQPPGRGPFRRRRPADRTQAAGRTRPSRNPSGVARCGGGARLHRAGAGRWRKRPAAACMCCMSPPAMKFRCWPRPRISPPPRPRRSI